MGKRQVQVTFGGPGEQIIGGVGEQILGGPGEQIYGETENLPHTGLETNSVREENGS
jgi:hypothetical protein